MLLRKKRTGDVGSQKKKVRENKPPGPEKRSPTTGRAGQAISSLVEAPPNGVPGEGTPTSQPS